MTAREFEARMRDVPACEHVWTSRMVRVGFWTHVTGYKQICKKCGLVVMECYVDGTDATS